MNHQIELIINGEVYELWVKPNRTLLDVIRDDLELTGTKMGCGTGDCGACTVLLDGRPVNACLVLALEARGKGIVTIEGLAQGGFLHPLQQAFIDQGAVQCGFCTPGMILTAKALLDTYPHPTELMIRRAMAGNICRCTGYTKIVKAILSAASARGTGY